VIRQYDHEVQGGSVLKPLLGAENDGPGKASITRPLLNSYRAVVLSNGLNPKYGLIDPYHMASSAIDEACATLSLSAAVWIVLLCSIISVGETPTNPIAWAVWCVRHGRAMISPRSMAPRLFQARTVSTTSIRPTAANHRYPTHAVDIGHCGDGRRSKAVSMDLKAAGNSIYAVGLTRKELGGSHYYEVLGLTSAAVPQVDGQRARRIF
jgi:phosphoribosylformylglycinamidine synthase